MPPRTESRGQAGHFSLPSVTREFEHFGWGKEKTARTGLQLRPPHSSPPHSSNYIIEEPLGPRHRTRAGWPRPISLDKPPSGPLKRPGRHPAACAAAHRPPGEQGYSGHPSGWRLLSVPISRGWFVDPAALAGPFAHLGSPVISEDLQIG